MIERAFDVTIRLVELMKRSYLRARLKYRISRNASGPERGQNLDVYSAPDMQRLLDVWGTHTVWNEVQYLVANCNGKILDIGCGTGATLRLLSKFEDCDLYGCDISEVLIARALDGGIPREKLTVCNAISMPYGDNYFDYSYSVAALHVFTEEGILGALKESHRVTKRRFFFQIPTARSAENEGWITPHQHYYNNSVDWWVDRCKTSYDKVHVLDSSWEDAISVGKWLVCVK